MTANVQRPLTYDEKVAHEREHYDELAYALRSNGQGDGDALATWGRVDLCAALAGEIEIITPSILRRDDGCALLYLGAVNGTHGDSGTGKSMVAAVAASQELTADQHVVWIDLEDSTPGTLIERLRMFGVDDDSIANRLHYHAPTEPFTTSAVDLIVDELNDIGARLVVIDSLGEAFGLQGVDENADKDVAPWMRRVARRLADNGAAVQVIDHSTKANDNPLHPSGSKRKRAAVTGASYLVDVVRPLTREHGGLLRLICAKDRHGHYGRGDTAAEIDFTVYPDGGMTLHVRAAAARRSPDEQVQTVARAAVRAAKDAERGLSGRELEALMNVKAAATVKRAGIDRAISLGALRTEPGPRRSTLHVYVRDLEPTP